MAIFVRDTFSGESSNTLLVNHTGETGATWTVIPGLSGMLVDATNNRVYANTAARGNYASGTPASAEYDVIADVFGRSDMGIVGRLIPEDGNYYHARLADTAAQLYRSTGGSFSLLGSFNQNTNGPHEVKLQIRDATKKVFIDGVERISSTDNTHTGAGFAGILGAFRASAWLDNFIADDLSAEGLTAPTLTFPENTATGVSLRPTFTWS